MSCRSQVSPSPQAWCWTLPSLPSKTFSGCVNAACQRGSRAEGNDQVWGALLASTATNVAIFVPVIFLKDVEGTAVRRSFADHRLCGFVSLIVAITVVPVSSMLFLRTRPKVSELASVWRRITDYVMGLTDTPRKRRLWIGGLIAGSVAGSWLLLPSLQYLPQVKRAAIDGLPAIPRRCDGRFRRQADSAPDRRSLAAYMTGKKQPKLLNYYVKMDGRGSAIWACGFQRRRLSQMRRLSQ